MARSSSIVRRRALGTAVALTVLTLVAVPALATSVADARHPSTLRAVATQQCADANLHPTAGNLKRIRRAILCLHNKVRAQNDLSPLRENRRLRRAALQPYAIGRHARP